MTPEHRRGILFGVALVGTAAAIGAAMSLDIHLGQTRQSAKYEALEREHQATAAALKKLGETAANNDRAWNSDHRRELTDTERAERAWAAAEAKWMDTDGNPATEPKRPTIATPHDDEETTAATANITAARPTTCINYIEKQNGERYCLKRF